MDERGDRGRDTDSNMPLPLFAFRGTVATATCAHTATIPRLIIRRLSRFSLLLRVADLLRCCLCRFLLGRYQVARHPRAFCSDIAAAPSNLCLLRRSLRHRRCGANGGTR